MNNKLKKVLVVGTTLASIRLVRCLAHANKQVLFDFISVPPHIQDVTNVNNITMHLNYIFIQQTEPGEFIVPLPWITDYIVNNGGQYDLIIICNYEFQRHHYFQEMRKKVRTPILCPDLISSRLEHEKLFAKGLLIDCDIPTPGYQVVSADDAIKIMDDTPLPIVFKLDKHMSFLGFGSWVFTDRSYHTAIPPLLADKTPDQKWYIEDFVNGKEISAHFLCNGSTWTYLGSARDYKRIHDGDRGHNTAGIGCYSPVEYFSDDAKKLLFSYLDKFLQYLTCIGIHYSGFLYVGAILTDKTLEILEINTRPGTPEFLTILEGLDHEILLADLYNAAARQPFIGQVPSRQAAVAVCLHHKNYDNVRKWNSIMPAVSFENDVTLVRSNQPLNKFNIYGAIIASAENRLSAAKKIYDCLGTSSCGDYTYRSDIGSLE